MAKILLFPLRLAVGYGLSPRVLGQIAIIMLVILRITIGYHFLSEGTEKYRAGNWTATPFFANAKGPLAGEFRKMVWDHDGKFRLDEKRVKIVWATYRDRIGSHYGFDQKQKEQAQRNYADAVDQWEYIVELNANEIEEFELGLGRIDKLDHDPVRDGVSSLGGQRESVRRELSQKINPTLKQIDAIWANYETAQKRVATSEQANSQPTYDLVKPRLALMDTSVIDKLLPYFDMTIGWMLILGMFTPIAALACGGFLLSVFLSQYPPSTGPGSSNYQLIEALACFVLAATGAGRFAGIDFFLHLLVRKTHGNSASSR
ncbi:DoxX family protein [Neorhodopirellula lusitana]|uniref:DoxX family protein n=1 Tax=Neorhodopirellula lusitana TaxID=445327 RepID=UPI00384E590F